MIDDDAAERMVEEESTADREVERLRKLIRAVVDAGAVEDTDLPCCHFCGAAADHVRSEWKVEHKPSCPWPALEAEAERAR